MTGPDLQPLVVKRVLALVRTETIPEDLGMVNGMRGWRSGNFEDHRM